jgi:type I restriction enzyme S subunit
MLMIAGSGGTRNALTKGMIEKFEINAPNLSEQRSIAKILGSLDDKIDLNRRMNAILEKIAQALFKHWFVDNPEAKRWTQKSLDEIARFLNGLALQKYPADDDGFLPVIKIAQLRVNRTNGADKASAKIPKEYIVNDGDILFSWSGSLDVVIWCGGKGALNQHLFKVTSEEYPKWFYYLWIKHHLLEFQEIALGKTTTMGHIQRHHLSEAKVIVPDKDTLSKMSEVMSPLLNRIISNSLETRIIITIHDLVLSRLMRGELNITNIIGV